MSDLVRLRKYVAMVEETHHDGGPVLARPVTKAVVGDFVTRRTGDRLAHDDQAADAGARRLSTRRPAR